MQKNCSYKQPPISFPSEYVLEWICWLNDSINDSFIKKAACFVSKWFWIGVLERIAVEWMIQGFIQKLLVSIVNKYAFLI